MIKRLFIRFIGLSGIIIIFITLLLSFKSFFLYRNLEIIYDKAQFVKDFNYTYQIPTTIEECPIWKFYDSCLKSPLFPYKKLDMVQMQQDYVHFVFEDGKETNLSQEGRWVLIDSIWNIFFVARSKYPDPMTYYGPFRYVK